MRSHSPRSSLGSSGAFPRTRGTATPSARRLAGIVAASNGSRPASARSSTITIATNAAWRIRSSALSHPNRSATPIGIEYVC